MSKEERERDPDEFTLMLFGWLTIISFAATIILFVLSIWTSGALSTRLGYTGVVTLMVTVIFAFFFWLVSDS